MAQAADLALYSATINVHVTFSPGSESCSGYRTIQNSGSAGVGGWKTNRLPSSLVPAATTLHLNQDHPHGFGLGDGLRLAPSI